MQRMTPVEAAKALGVRPQIIYGFIKHNRIHTYPNPSGKTAHIDLDEVKRATGSVQHHRPKDPSTGKPVRHTADVRTGTILSYHGHTPGEVKTRPHRVVAVTQLVSNDEGEPSLVYTARGEGELAVIYETEDLATAIGVKKCNIESPAKLLGVLMYHWVHNEQVELAAELQRWCEARDIEFGTITEGA